MQQQHYKTILYFISAVILATVGMQGYWIYKNHQAGKQQLINEVQISLDNAVHNYYAARAEKTFEGFAFWGNHADDTLTQPTTIFWSNDTLRPRQNVWEKDTLHPAKLNAKKLDRIFNELILIDSLTTTEDTHVKININLGDVSNPENDTIAVFKEIQLQTGDTLFENFSISNRFPHKIPNIKDKQDTIFNNPLTKLTSRVLYGLTENAIDLQTVDSLLIEELDRKKITVDHKIIYQHPLSKQSIGTLTDTSEILSTESNSEFLPKKALLQVDFTNITSTILKRNLLGLLLSLLFVTAIIASLLYLLHIIKSQKQLAEVKNDLISNITHEFKTPLATIGAAMEGIQVFNKNNDPQKTLKYAQISTSQVTKLTTMVEKLLETATLDGEQLELNFEKIDLVHLLETIGNKEMFTYHNKAITFTSNVKDCMHAVDVFHFENAMNNIIDNAIKYGGDCIEIALHKTAKEITISINDHGTHLTPAQSKQIFEKFYRVPKGNTHDVKGFGIGLYYTKAIIEKHKGTIRIYTKPTVFKITLPNG